MGSEATHSFQAGIAVAPSKTPVYVERTTPVNAETICDALVSTLTVRPGRRRSNSPQTAAAAALLENATRVHDPIDIGLCILKTRSMFKKREGTAMSASNKSGAIIAPIAPIQRN